MRQTRQSANDHIADISLLAGPIASRHFKLTHYRIVIVVAFGVLAE